MIFTSGNGTEGGGREGGKEGGGRGEWRREEEGGRGKEGDL
jgi:hypothetical protein